MKVELYVLLPLTSKETRKSPVGYLHGELDEDPDLKENDLTIISRAGMPDIECLVVQRAEETENGHIIIRYGLEIADRTLAVIYAEQVKQADPDLFLDNNLHS